MSQLLFGRGRKKVVNRFTLADGLWMIAVLSLGCIFVFALFLLGYLRVD
jgi:hypothetical protein